MQLYLLVHVASNMEKPNSSAGLYRTQSDQLTKITEGDTMKSFESNEVTKDVDSRTLSRKSSKNQVLKKGKSGQIKFDFDDAGSGAALSRASSASLGFSFSLSGFTMPPDEISDSIPSNDDEIRKYFMLIN